jgi:hypothetical protein
MLVRPHADHVFERTASIKAEEVQHPSCRPPRNHTSKYTQVHTCSCIHPTMRLLLSGPPEIVTRILQSCDDFPQLLSFIGTCKRLYSVWETNSDIIAWGVGQRSIVAFNDALMAVCILLFSSPCVGASLFLAAGLLRTKNEGFRLGCWLSSLRFLMRVITDILYGGTGHGHCQDRTNVWETTA